MRTVRSQCENCAMIERVGDRGFLDLPALDDARLGLSGLIIKLFHPERDLFSHANRKMRSTDNASARRNLARALDSKPDALKKTDTEWSLVRHREFAARQSGKAWNRNAVRRKNSTNDDIMVGFCKELNSGLKEEAISQNEIKELGIW